MRTKIIVWSFVPTMIILVTVAITIFYAYQDVTQDLVIERNHELVRLTVGQLSANLQSYANVLNDEARIADIYGNDSSAQRAALRRARNRLAVFDAGVLILDYYGTVVVAEPNRPEILGQNWSNRAYFRQLLLSQTAGAAFSDVVTDGPDDARVIVVAVPIVGARGEFVGVMTGMFRVSATMVNIFYDDITRFGLGENGNAYLVDGQGWVIYHSDPYHIGENLSAQEVVQQIMQGETGVVRTRDLGGQEIVASFAPVPGTPWGLVTEEDWATLISAGQGYRQFLLLLLALGVIVPTVVVAVGVQRITKPVTELTEAAQKVAAGNFDQTITAQTGDEMEELAEQFSLMAAQLEESYAILERQVTDRTKELDTLNAIAAMMSQSLDLDVLLSNALDKTLQAMEIEAGGIYLLDESSNTLTIAAHQGFRAEFVAEVDNLKVGEGFSGRVAQSGEPMVVKDVSANPHLTRMAAREEGLRSLTIVPLSSKGRVLGTLFVVTYGYRQFTDHDVQLLSSIGHQVGVTIENARFFKAEQRRAEQFRVISEVGRRITSILDVDELLMEIVRLLKETFGYYLITIGLVEGNEIVFKAGDKTHWHEPQFRPPPTKVGGPGITAWVATTGEPLLAPDVGEEPRYLLWPSVSETRSELAVPLKTRAGGIMGVLNVESDELNAFDESDIQVLQSLANQAAVAIENARLYEQAHQLAALEERGRLARELHDAVTQTLFSASLIAEVLPRVWELDPEDGRQQLEEVRILTRGALAEMRTLLLELRPDSLSKSRMGDLLRQLGRAITGRTGISVTVTAEDEWSLPPAVQIPLYRIAQEALNNVGKHAKAKRVDVDFTCEPGLAALVISDDGQGFDVDNIPPGHFGVGIMQERAESIGAVLEITSQPGAGTRVTVNWQEQTEEQ
jgi:nitrate/nitrite-specific signal transduction histidine kinase